MDTNLAAHKVFGYLIVISPPEDIQEYANRIKSEFLKRYGPYDGIKSKPHITICNFPLLEKREEKVLSIFQEGLQEVEPFEVEIDGFGCFDGSNVIYLNVKESKNTKPLKQCLAYKRVDADLRKRFFLFESGKLHLTIGKKLESSIFEDAQNEYLNRSYNHAFTVDRLKVLRFDFKERRYFDIGDLMLGDT